MAIAQLSDDRDGVQTSILSERCWDDFECIGVGQEAVGFHPLEGMCVLGEET
jgi:hypothetical protein